MSEQEDGPEEDRLERLVRNSVLPNESPLASILLPLLQEIQELPVELERNSIDNPAELCNMLRMLICGKAVEEAYRTHRRRETLRNEEDRHDLTLRLPEATLQEVSVGWPKIRHGVLERLGITISNARLEPTDGPGQILYRGRVQAILSDCDEPVESLIDELCALCHKWLTIDKVEAMLHELDQASPYLIKELRSHGLNLRTVHEVLVAMLREGVSICDLETILSTVLENWKLTKVAEFHVEFIRARLGCQVTAGFKYLPTSLPTVTFSPETEEQISNSIERTANGQFLNFDPEIGQRLLYAIEENTNYLQKTRPFVLLVSPQIRLGISQLVKRVFPKLRVLSWNEIDDITEVDEILEIEMV